MDSIIGEVPLWLRALRAPGWRWAPGMSAVHLNWGTVNVCKVDEAKGVAACLCTHPAGYHSGPVAVSLSLAQMRPDLFDSATKHQLLETVRRTYGDDAITAQYHQSLGAPERKRWRVWRDGNPIAYGASEQEALIVALERAAT